MLVPVWQDYGLETWAYLYNLSMKMQAVDPEKTKQVHKYPTEYIVIM